MKKVMAYGLAVFIACATGAWAQMAKPKDTKKIDGATTIKYQKKGKGGKGWHSKFKEGKKLHPEESQSPAQH